jgi:hypothetical protein
MNEPNFIIEHRVVFIDDPRIDEIGVALATLTGKVQEMATAQETIETELGETEGKAQAALDAATVVGEVVADLRQAIADLQANQGNVIPQATLDAWKARSDGMQAKLDDALGKLSTAITPAAAPTP